MTLPTPFNVIAATRPFAGPTGFGRMTRVVRTRKLHIHRLVAAATERAIDRQLRDARRRHDDSRGSRMLGEVQNCKLVARPVAPLEGGCTRWNPRLRGGALGGRPAVDPGAGGLVRRRSRRGARDPPDGGGSPRPHEGFLAEALRRFLLDHAARRRLPAARARGRGDRSSSPSTPSRCCRRRPRASTSSSPASSTCARCSSSRSPSELARDGDVHDDARVRAGTARRTSRSRTSW